MKRKILSNRDGLKISHTDMVALRQSGVINLVIENELSATIAGVTNIGPQKTTAVLAFQFWNWVAVGAFIGSIYWSFTKNWWWFILGIILMRAIWSSNKKRNAKNFLDAAMIDKEFYERVLALDGWMYQFKEENYELLKKYIVDESNQDLIGKFSQLMGEIDIFLTFWDEKKLGVKKHDLQMEIIKKIKSAENEEVKQVFLIALQATCQFVPKLGEPISDVPRDLIPRETSPEKLSDDELMVIANQWTNKNNSEKKEKYANLKENAEKEFEHLKIKYSI